MSDLEVPRLLFCAFAEVPGPCAIGTRMRLLLQALPENVEVDALTLRADGLPHIQRMGLARMMRVAASGSSFVERLETFQRALARQLAAEKYTLIFCADFFSASVAADVKKEHGFTLVLEAGAFPVTAFSAIYPVDKHDADLKRKWSALERTVLKETDVFLTPSRYGARVFSARVDARRVQLLPRWVERYFFNDQGAVNFALSEKLYPMADKRKLVVVFERRATARRTAVLRILQAMNESTSRRQVRLAVLGRVQEDDRLKEDLKSLHLERVELFDGNSPQEIAAHLCKADVVVVPTTSEEGLDGFAIPHRALEAMACKAPVVITGSEGPFRNVLKNGHSGVVVEEQAPEKVASSVVKLLESPSWRSELAERAQQNMIEKASRQAQVSDFMRFLAKLLKVRLEARSLEVEGEFVEDRPPENAVELKSFEPRGSEKSSESLLPSPYAPPLEQKVDSLFFSMKNASLGELQAERAEGVHIKTSKVQKTDEPNSIVFAANENANLPAVNLLENRPLLDDELGAFSELTDSAPSLADKSAPLSTDAVDAPLDEIASLNRASRSRAGGRRGKSASRRGPPPLRGAKIAQIKSGAHLISPASSILLEDSGMQRQAKISGETPLLSAKNSNEPEKTMALKGDERAAETTEKGPAALSAFKENAHKRAELAPAEFAQKDAADLNRKRPPPIREIRSNASSTASFKSAIPTFSKALHIDLDNADVKEGQATDFLAELSTADTQISTFQAVERVQTSVNEKDQKAAEPTAVIEQSMKTSLESERLQAGNENKKRDPWKNDTVADARPLFTDVVRSQHEGIEFVGHLVEDPFRGAETLQVSVKTGLDTASEPTAGLKENANDYTTEDGLQPKSEK